MKEIIDLSCIHLPVPPFTTGHCLSCDEDEEYNEPIYEDYESKRYRYEIKVCCRHSFQELKLSEKELRSVIAKTVRNQRNDIYPTTLYYT